MIKPDATSKGHTGAILDQMIKAGFSVKAMKWIQLSEAQAGAFYAVHKERPFYGELVEFMSSGPIVAAILEKNNAIIARLFGGQCGQKPTRVALYLDENMAT